jgi:hypothetical protein
MSDDTDARRAGPITGRSSSCPSFHSRPKNLAPTKIFMTNSEVFPLERTLGSLYYTQMTDFFKISSEVLLLEETLGSQFYGSYDLTPMTDDTDAGRAGPKLETRVPVLPSSPNPNVWPLPHASRSTVKFCCWKELSDPIITEVEMSDDTDVCRAVPKTGNSSSCPSFHSRPKLLASNTICMISSEVLLLEGTLGSYYYGRYDRTPMKLEFLPFLSP